MAERTVDLTNGGQAEAFPTHFHALSSSARRRQQRELAHRLARDFGVTFDLAFKAVRAGVHGRCAELAETIGDCRRLGFIAAVQTLTFRSPTRSTGATP